MASEKIISTGPLPDWAAAKLRVRYELVTLQQPTAATLSAALDTQVAGLIVRGSIPIGGELLQRAPCLRVIARAGVGVDQIDLTAVTQRRIPVVYTPGANARPVAEHALALIISAAKDLPEWQRALKDGDWKRRYLSCSRDLQGLTLGIVGFGRVGAELWKLATRLGMRVVACDLNPLPPRFKNPPPLISLHELLSESDVVSLHVPLNDGTRRLINAAALQELKPGAILVNTARGGLIESYDLLLEALQGGRLSYVALDVFAEEPPHLKHPFFSHPRVILTPHVAAKTPIAVEQIFRDLIPDMLRVLEGKIPRLGNIANVELFDNNPTK
ncbi:MAG: hypothetical protein HY645_09645 [Acidobacteria bacterium]|nr:hypothetical protein [Acidobacteriota bacterium]